MIKLLGGYYLVRILYPILSISIIGITGYLWYRHYFNVIDFFGKGTIYWAVGFATIPVLALQVSLYYVFNSRRFTRAISVLLFLLTFFVWSVSLALISNDYKIH